jgi:DNA-binding response OmpR family regulator
MAKILLVEDERSIRQAIRFELEDAGHDVESVSDYAEASSAVQAFKFDLIISDIFFRRGNGLQFMDVIRSMHITTPFIAITAWPESDAGMRIQTLLQERFLAKPFITLALLQKVSEVIRNAVPGSELTGSLA